MNDEELIQKFYEGDHRAFTMIFERHKPGVFNFALRMTGSRPDAEDVTSETFMKVCDAEHRFVHASARFKTWLYTITRNACIDRLRQKKRWVQFWMKKPGTDEVQEMDFADESDTPSQSFEKKELIRQVQLAISKLPMDQREALLLREYQDMPYDDIAHVMGTTLANVKVLIFRARTQLKNDLPAVVREGR